MHDTSKKSRPRQSEKSGTTTFADLKGLLKGALKQHGGGEALIRSERASFYDQDEIEKGKNARKRRRVTNQTPAQTKKERE